MSRVLFLHDAIDRLHAATMWLSTQYATGSLVSVYVPDPDHAARLDRLLWEQPSIGFTPHCDNGNALTGETPIVLCAHPPARWPHPIVLNVSNEVPAPLDEIELLVEIVSQDVATRAAGRKRYRAYQEAGFVVEARNIERATERDF